MNKQILKYALFTILLTATVTIALFFDSKYIFSIPDVFVAITQIFLASIIALLAMLSALYFIYVQTYLNRYPLKLINKKFNIPILYCSIIMIFDIIFGTMTLALNLGFFINALYWIISVMIIVILVILTFNSTRLLSISYYANKYVEETRAIIENDPNKEALQNTLSELYQIFDECISKEEYYVAQIICDSTKEILNGLLKEINGHIIEQKINEKDAIILGIIVYQSSFKQIRRVSDQCSSQFEDTIIYAPISYLLTCSDIGQYSLYKEFVDILSSQLYSFQNNNQKRIVKLLYSNLEDLVDRLLIQKERSEWVSYLFNELFSMTNALSYVNDSYDMRDYARLITYCLLKSFDTSCYNNVFEIFQSFTISVARTTRNFEHIVIYYASISKKLIEKKDEEKINDYIALLDKIQKYLISDTKWIDYLFIFVSWLAQEMPLRYKKEMRQKNINILADLILLEESDLHSVNILMPNYMEDVKEHCSDVVYIKEIAEDFKHFCTLSIRRNNTSTYYIFIQNINQCLLVLPRSSREPQEALFDVYDQVLFLVSNVSNQTFPEMTLSMLNSVISSMDKERQISKEFAYKIIKIFTDHASHGSYISDYMRDNLIEQLRDWFCEEDDIKTFISNDIEAKKLLFKSIYQIGLDCIEYGKEESLRKVSNSLGWALIRSMQRGENDAIIKQLTGLAQNTYRIAKRMKVSSSTQLFLLTLFTTVGTFCETSSHLLRYQVSFVSFLANEDYDLVETATQVRTSESDNWDSLFNKKTKEYTNRFLKKVRVFKQA